MARTKSEDKRSAILEAAIDLFAERGVWATPTSAISKAAGIAEGTLFTYFATKDVLLNELYRTLKLELADALLVAFPSNADVRDKFRHIWNQYVSWGASHPERYKVMMQLNVSEQITSESKAVGYAPFAELEQAAAESIRQHLIQDYPVEFMAAVLGALAEATMAFMAHSSGAAVERYRSAGFEIFWDGIGRR